MRRRRPSGASSWPQLQRSRDLTWDGLLNVRDLGGHQTEDGGETRYGEVVRADSLHQLTEDGWQSVVDYGIRTVVDLRMDDEREGDPPPELRSSCCTSRSSTTTRRSSERSTPRRRLLPTSLPPHARCTSCSSSTSRRTWRRRYAPSRTRPRAGSSCTAWAGRTERGSSPRCCSRLPAWTTSRSPPTTR